MLGTGGNRKNRGYPLLCCLCFLLFKMRAPKQEFGTPQVNAGRLRISAGQTNLSVAVSESVFCCKEPRDDASWCWASGVASRDAVLPGSGSCPGDQLTVAAGGRQAQGRVDGSSGPSVADRVQISGRVRRSDRGWRQAGLPGDRAGARRLPGRAVARRTARGRLGRQEQDADGRPTGRRDGRIRAGQRQPAIPGRQPQGVFRDATISTGRPQAVHRDGQWRSDERQDGRRQVVRTQKDRPQKPDRGRAVARGGDRVAGRQPSGRMEWRTAG